MTLRERQGGLSPALGQVLVKVSGNPAWASDRPRVRGRCRPAAAVHRLPGPRVRTCRSTTSRGRGTVPTISWRASTRPHRRGAPQMWRRAMAGATPGAVVELRHHAAERDAMRMHADTDPDELIAGPCWQQPTRRAEGVAATRRRRALPRRPARCCTGPSSGAMPPSAGCPMELHGTDHGARETRWGQQGVGFDAIYRDGPSPAPSRSCHRITEPAPEIGTLTRELAPLFTLINLRSRNLQTGHGATSCEQEAGSASGHRSAASPSEEVAERRLLDGRPGGLRHGFWHLGVGSMVS